MIFNLETGQWEDVPIRYPFETPGGDTTLNSAYNKYAPYGGEEQGKTLRDNKTTSLGLGQNVQQTPLLSSNRVTSEPSTTTTTTEPTTTRTTPILPEEGMPTLEGLPSGLEIDPWDEQEIARLTQKYSAPGVMKLGAAVNLAATRTYSSLIEKDLTLREAISGYGMGLESIIAGASQTAMSQYQARRDEEYRKAALEYETEKEGAMAQYQASLARYMALIGTEVERTGGGQVVEKAGEEVTTVTGPGDLSEDASTLIGRSSWAGGTGFRAPPKSTSIMGGLV